MLKTPLAAMIAVSLAVAGCATNTLPAGAKCSATADCDSGLMCLDVAQFAGTTCTVVGKACSIVCTGDPGCTSLGTNFKCFAGCGADMTCEMAGP
jgi:hypothetical protein